MTFDKILKYFGIEDESKIEAMICILPVLNVNYDGIHKDAFLKKILKK